MTFIDMEIRYGILQVADALYYLHTTERLLHLNVCPQNVIVTKRGMWKLTGLCFTQNIGSDAQSKVRLSFATTNTTITQWLKCKIRGWGTLH